MVKKILKGIKNRKMGFRLLTGFMILVIFVGGLISGLIFYQFAQLSTTLKNMALYQIPVVESATNVERYILSALDYEKTYLITNEAVYREKTEAAIDNASASLSELIQTAEKFNDSELGSKANKIWFALESYRKSFLKVAAAIDENLSLGEETMESGNNLNQIELLALQETMRTKGEEIQQISQDVQITNWKSMETAQIGLIDEMKTARTRLILVLMFSFLLAALLARQISRTITKPLAAITGQAKRIAEGDLLRDSEQAERLSLSKRKDEIGDIAAAFEKLITYLQNIGFTAGKVAQGNLAVEFQPASENDELGRAFLAMVQQLRLSMLDVTKNITVMNQFSEKMAQIASQTDSAAQQISNTMDQVAHGNSEQAASLQEAFAAIKISQSTIAEIVSGFDQQLMAVNQGISVSEHVVNAVQSVSENIQLVVNESEEATQTAQNGAEKIGAALQNMETIQLQVERSQEKVSAMQSQSGKIGRIVETIEDIASQTNLLAINATIEAAHAETDSKSLTESMLERFMLAACEMVARLLETSNQISHSYWVELGKMADIDQILIMDDDGVIVEGNDPSIMGFRFPEDDPQTAEFRTLIGKKNGKVCQPAQMRAADKKVFKYVGISRRDQPGIIQVGYNMSTLALFNFQIGGFTIVAREVYELAENSRMATKEIRQLLKAIKDAANEANQEMQNSVDSVKTSLTEAANAGENLNEILTAFAQVSQQTYTAAQATQQMKLLSGEFRSAIQSIHEVVIANSKLASQLRQHTNEMTGSMDQIANAGEENSASAEAVTASTKALQNQVIDVSQTADQLSEMANHLANIVTNFDLEN